MPTPPLVCSIATALREVATAPVGYAELPGAQHAFDVFGSRRARHSAVAGRFLSWLYATSHRD